MRWLMAMLLAAAVTPAGATSLTIEDATSRALAANPKVRASQLEALAAEQRADQARGRHFGELSLLVSANHFESPRLVRPMSIDLFSDPAAGFAQLPWDDDQVHYGVGFHVPLLAGGSLREGDRIAGLARSAAEHSAQFSVEEVRMAVRGAYRGALLARHALAASQAYREALERDEADAQLKLKLGALAAVDAAKVTFALRGAEAQVAALAAQERTAQATLAALMGEAPPAEEYELGDVTGEPVMPAEGATLEGALAGRSDLAAVRAATEIAKRRKALARDAFGPLLALEGSWLRNDAPSLDHALDTHEVSLMFKLPLFDGFVRAHAVEEADTNLQAARERERASELEVSAQVVDAQGRLEAARALLAAGTAQRSLGAEVARVEHLKLEQGTGKMEDYLAARAQEAVGETSYWQGLYSFQNAADYLDFVAARGGQND